MIITGHTRRFLTGLIGLTLVSSLSIFAQPSGFRIVGTSSQVAGTAQDLTIIADSAGVPAESYAGPQRLVFSGSSASPNGDTPTVTDSGGTAVLFGDTVTILFVNGVGQVTGSANGRLTLYRAGIDSITVTDGAYVTLPDGALKIEVSPTTALNVIVETLPDGLGERVREDTIASGSALTVYAVTRDSFGNYVGNLPATYSLVSTTGGVDSADLVPSGDGRSATFNGDIEGSAIIQPGRDELEPVSSGSITVVAAPATRLVISGSSTQVAGATQNLVIRARDNAGNIDTGYRNNKNLVFSGADSSLSPARAPTVVDRNGVARAFGVTTQITFTFGVAVVSAGENGVMKLVRAQNAVISVTDGNISSAGADRLTVTVSPNAFNKFAVALASPQSSGTPFTGSNTITAEDSLGNAITTYDAQADPVTVTTTLPGVISGLGSAGNNVLDQTTDFVSGVADVTGALRYTGAVGTGTFTATAAPARTGTSGNVTIIAGGATRLVLTGDTTQTAGTTNDLTITARDASGNIVTTYSGDKTLRFAGASSSPGPAVLPYVVDNTGVPRPFGSPTVIGFTNGVASTTLGRNGVMVLTNAVRSTITTTDDTVSATGPDALTVNVQPAPLSRFDLNFGSPQVNGQPFTAPATVTAADTFGNVRTTFSALANPVTISSSLSGDVSGLGGPGGDRLDQATSFLNGVADLSGRLIFSGKAGTGTFTATSLSGKRGSSGPVTLKAGKATRLRLTGLTAQVAGVGQPLTIRALDDSSNIDSSYTGDKGLVFSGAALSPDTTAPTVSDRNGIARPFGGATVITFNNGVSTVTGGTNNGVMTLVAVQNATISVTDGSISSAGGDRLAVLVSPGPLDRFKVQLTSPQVNGQTFTGTNLITALDAFDNVLTGFNALTNNVTLTSTIPGVITGLGSGGNNVLNQAGDFVGGTADLTGKMRFIGSSGSGTFTATSATGRSGSSGIIQISAGNAVRLAITGTSTQVAGETQALTITARDASGNTVPGYTGSKSLTFSGAFPSSDPVVNPTVTASGGAAVPFGQATSIQFVNGVATISGSANGLMRLVRVGTDTISATDGTASALGGDRLVVTVSPAPLQKFQVKFSSPQVNGAAFTGTNTITASDAFGNILTNFDAANNNVSLTSSLPGTITGLGSLSNNVLNRTADFAAGVADLSGKLTFTGTGGRTVFTASSSQSAAGGLSDSILINNPAPTITSVLPDTVNRTSSALMAVQGTNFFPGVTTASFGPATTLDSLRVLNSTSLVAHVTVASSAVPGPRDVSVTNAGPGGGTATSTNAVTVRDVPRLASLAPQTGVRGQTIDVVIAGVNFQDGVSTVGIFPPTILLNSQTVDSPTRMTANITIPVSAVDGVRTITVTNSGPYGGVSNGLGFSVGNNPVPTITSITPNSATRLQILTVTVRGTNFFSGLTTLNAGAGIAVSNLTVDSTTQLRATLTVSDSAATGLRTISVVNSAPGGGIGNLADGFTVVNPVPDITGITPQSAGRLQTRAVTVTGARFINGVTTLSLGPNVTVSALSVTGPTQLTANVTVDSIAATGLRHVIVSNVLPGGGADTLKDAFSITTVGATITSVVPDSVIVGSTGLTATVNGASFGPESYVRFDADSLATTFVSSSRLTAVVPAALLDTARIVGVSVFTPGAGATTSLPFRVVNPLPVLASVDPDTVTRSQTVVVILTGTGFIRGVTTIAIAPSTGITIDSLRFQSGTQMTARVAVASDATAGVRSLTVNNAGPGGGTSSSLPFTISGNPAPILTAITPSSGGRLQTLDVTLVGSNFLPGLSVVNFGSGISVTNPRATPEGNLLVTISIALGAATGQRNVTVTNPAPGGGTSSAVPFTVNNPVPVITSVSPSNGGLLQTYDLTVRGRYFINGVTGFSITGRILVNSFAVQSDTVITANVTIPGDATFGPRDVSVINGPPGGGSAVLSGGFVVGENPVPIALRVDPDTVSRLSDHGLVVTGSNFLGGVTTVDLGTGFTVRSVTVESDTQLIALVSVLASAPTGPRDLILVNGAPGGGRDTIPGGLMVLNPKPTIASLTPTSAEPGQGFSMIIRGTGFIQGVSSTSLGAGMSSSLVAVDADTQMTAVVAVADDALPGPRSIAVVNAAPGGGTSNGREFTVVASILAPRLIAPAENAGNVPSFATLRWNARLGATGYHPQVSLDSTFAAIQFQDSTITDTSWQAGPLQGDSRYYWRVRVLYGGIYGPYSEARRFQTAPDYPTTYTLSASVAYPLKPNPSDYQPTEYRMVGLPGAFTGMVSDIVGGTNEQDWQAYWDTGVPDDAQALVPYNGTSAFAFSPGRAFWVIKKGTLEISRSVPTVPLDGTGTVSIDVHSGWNLLTNPFTVPVDWGAVQTLNGVTEPIFGFDGAFATATTMQPYAGYYFFNSEGVTSIKIPYSGSGPSGGQLAKPAASGWEIVLGLSADGYRENAVRAGVRLDASAGLDPADVRRPRAVGAVPGISFHRPTWDSLYSTFLTDIRPSVRQVEEWEFQIASGGKKELTLTFEGVGEISRDMAVYVIDRDRARSIDLRSSASYRFAPARARSTFSLLVGAESAVMAKVNDMLPKEFALEPNFPNPFNPETTVPVAVPIQSRVSVRIYNTLGQEIRVLYSGDLAAGRHWFRWDGRDEVGVSVATGVYIYSLVTDGGVRLARKMMLLK